MLPYPLSMFYRALLALVSFSIVSCGVPPLAWLSPEPDQLSLSAALTAEIQLPDDAVATTLRVELDGLDVSGEFSAASGVASATLNGLAPGPHTLHAQVDLSGGGDQQADVSFETADLTLPEKCELLNNVTCLLPYPSSRFLVPAVTDTGVRLNLPAEGAPTPNGPALTTDAYNELDGFSPGVQMLMHFPGGVDVERSNAPRLLAPGCCGQPAGPPWIDTRTVDERSLQSDSPTVLLDADTGERILHFSEVDISAAGPERQIFFMRPGEMLLPGHRYIVAVRNLVHPDGSAVVAEAPFAVLRDDRPTDIPALQERKAYYETDIFPALAQAGIAREELILSYDFVVQSEHQLTHQMLAMRDEAFEWLQDREDADDVTFTVTHVTDPQACTDPSNPLAYRVEGTYQSPNFLDGDYLANPLGVQFANVDENDTPVMNGTVNALFTIGVPCSALQENPPTIHPLLLGHGLLGTGRPFIKQVADTVGPLMNSFGGLGQYNAITGATDWSGLSSPDLAWLGASILGLGQNKLNNFAAFPDRLRQGQLNTLVLARMMKRGHFNSHPAFQTEGGTGIFPGPETEMFYFGSSLGGIMGLMFAALTPDVERLHVDSAGINFSGLLPRATPFDPFKQVLESVGLTDPMDLVLVITLGHELWISAESGGYARHIIDDPLPGSIQKRILLTVAWLDKQVTNHFSEVAARTLGLPQLLGSVQQELVAIPDEAGPLDSAMVTYATGSFDLFDPAHQPFIPPLTNEIPSDKCDPHGGERSSIPAGTLQQLQFLQPGGVIHNFCTGPGNICDGATPWEKPRGELTSCDPLS